MTTVRDIITGAVRLLGTLRKGETLSADDVQDGFVALNDMIASWGNDSLLINARAWESFNIGAGSSYTLGVGQTINTTRPSSIQDAFVRIGNIDYTLTPLTDVEYERIPYKNLSSNIPQWYNYDNGFPTGIIRIYPYLSVSAELHLLSEKPITEFTDVNQTIVVTPGTNRALRSNLALELAPEYRVEPSASLVRMASTSLDSIMLAIAKNRPVKYQAPPTLRGNIYNGWLSS